MKKLTRFLAAAFAELKKVKWPTFQQVTRYTIAVLFVIVFFASFSKLVNLFMSLLIERF